MGKSSEPGSGASAAGLIAAGSWFGHGWFRRLFGLGRATAEVTNVDPRPDASVFAGHHFHQDQLNVRTILGSSVRNPLFGLDDNEAYLAVDDNPYVRGPDEEYVLVEEITHETTIALTPDESKALLKTLSHYDTISEHYDISFHPSDNKEQTTVRLTLREGQTSLNGEEIESFFSELWAQQPLPPLPTQKQSANLYETPKQTKSTQAFYAIRRIIGTKDRNSEDFSEYFHVLMADSDADSPVRDSDFCKLAERVLFEQLMDDLGYSREDIDAAISEEEPRYQSANGPKAVQEIKVFHAAFKNAMKTTAEDAQEIFAQECQKKGKAADAKSIGEYLNARQILQDERNKRLNVGQQQSPLVPQRPSFKIKNKFLKQIEVNPGNDPENNQKLNNAFQDLMGEKPQDVNVQNSQFCELAELQLFANLIGQSEEAQNSQQEIIDQFHPDTVYSEIPDADIVKLKNLFNNIMKEKNPKNAILLFKKKYNNKFQLDLDDSIIQDYLKVREELQNYLKNRKQPLLPVSPTDSLELEISNSNRPARKSTLLDTVDKGLSEEQEALFHKLMNQLGYKPEDITESMYVLPQDTDLPEKQKTMNVLREAFEKMVTSGVPADVLSFEEACLKQTGKDKLPTGFSKMLRQGRVDVPPALPPRAKKSPKEQAKQAIMGIIEHYCNNDAVFPEKELEQLFKDIDSGKNTVALQRFYSTAIFHINANKGKDPNSFAQDTFQNEIGNILDEYRAAVNTAINNDKILHNILEIMDLKDEGLYSTVSEEGSPPVNLERKLKELFKEGVVDFEQKHQEISEFFKLYVDNADQNLSTEKKEKILEAIRPLVKGVEDDEWKEFVKGCVSYTRAVEVKTQAPVASSPNNDYEEVPNHLQSQRPDEVLYKVLPDEVLPELLPTDKDYVLNNILGIMGIPKELIYNTRKNAALAESSSRIKMKFNTLFGQGPVDFEKNQEEISEFFKLCVENAGTVLPTKQKEKILEAIRPLVENVQENEWEAFIQNCVSATETIYAEIPVHKDDVLNHILEIMDIRTSFVEQKPTSEFPKKEIKITKNLNKLLKNSPIDFKNNKEKISKFFKLCVKNAGKNLSPEEKKQILEAIRPLVENVKKNEWEAFIQGCVSSIRTVGVKKVKKSQAPVVNSSASNTDKQADASEPGYELVSQAQRSNKLYTQLQPSNDKILNNILKIMNIQSGGFYSSVAAAVEVQPGSPKAQIEMKLNELLKENPINFEEKQEEISDFFNLCVEHSEMDLSTDQKKQILEAIRPLVDNVPKSQWEAFVQDCVPATKTIYETIYETIPTNNDDALHNILGVIGIQGEGFYSSVAEGQQPASPKAQIEMKLNTLFKDSPIDFEQKHQEISEFFNLCVEHAGTDLSTEQKEKILEAIKPLVNCDESKWKEFVERKAEALYSSVADNTADPVDTQFYSSVAETADPLDQIMRRAGNGDQEKRQNLRDALDQLVKSSDSTTTATLYYNKYEQCLTNLFGEKSDSNTLRHEFEEKVIEKHGIQGPQSALYYRSQHPSASPSEVQSPPSQER